MGAGLSAGRAGPRASESNVIGAVFENIWPPSGTKFQTALLATESEALVSVAAKAVEKKTAESSSFRLNGWKLSCWPQRAKLRRQKRRSLSEANPLSLMCSG